MRAMFAILIAATAAPAAAHHGWSEYDASKPLTVTGKVVASGYEHPHGHVRLQALDRAWHVVLAPPTRMRNRGLPPAALEPGGTVTVTGYASRDNPEEMRAERITAGGKTVELR